MATILHPNFLVACRVASRRVAVSHVYKNLDEMSDNDSKEQAGSDVGSVADVYMEIIVDCKKFVDIDVAQRQALNGTLRMKVKVQKSVGELFRMVYAFAEIPMNKPPRSQVTEWKISISMSGRQSWQHSESIQRVAKDTCSSKLCKVLPMHREVAEAKDSSMEKNTVGTFQRIVGPKGAESPAEVVPEGVPPWDRGSLRMDDGLGFDMAGLCAMVVLPDCVARVDLRLGGVEYRNPSATRPLRRKIGI
ncbi:hypothetical protein B0H14DRAFT_2567449 [Mycena olivaceomarginata]|nr:hypothetical protein B0H14DRAFT_2567449 [Mycena olivaceomarginata]